MTTWKIHTADVMDWAASYDGPKFHALLCDPPYELKFMGKRWDASGVSFRPETWAALAEHLHPGAFGMAFASSRGWHRLAVAIEDAGMVIQPSIFGWATGQSFPKATRIDTQIDKRRRRDYVLAAIELGLDIPSNNRHDWTIQDHIPSDKWWEKFKAVLSSKDWQAIERKVLNNVEKPPGWFTQGNDYDITAPATPLARAWVGHRYGGQVLKNALEPIIVFQKPWEGKRLDCIVETGAGAMWVDGGRIGTNPNDSNHRTPSVPFHKGGNEIYGDGLSGRPIENLSPQGRWPSNFTLTHHPDCRRVGTRRVNIPKEKRSHPRRNVRDPYEGYRPGTNCTLGIETAGYADPDGYETVTAWECVPECVVRKLGEMSGARGQLVKGDYKRKSLKFPGTVYEHSWTRRDGNDTGANYNDTGTAARFYYQADWSYEIAERLAMADPVHYCPKSSRKERDSGLTNFVTLELEVCLCGEKMEQVTSLERAISEYVMGLEDQLCSTDLSGNGRMVQSHQVILFTTLTETDKTTVLKTWNVLTLLLTREFIVGVIKMLRGIGLNLAASVENISRLLLTSMNEKVASARGVKNVVSETPLKISASAKPRRNVHPTCKPIALARWLATLLLPPPEYAPHRLLIPFSGSGSEGIGAGLAGWEEMVLIDLLAENNEIAEARLQHWLNRQQLELNL